MKHSIVLFVLIIFTTFSFASNEEFAKDFSYMQNYQKAKEKSLHVNKPLLVLFVTTTCPWCKKLENQTLSKEHINEFIHKNFIPVVLDKEKDTYPQFLQPKVVPTIYFVDTKKEKSFGEILGYKNKSDFYELLQKASLRAKEQK
ncbi:MAG TPA: hypothetical protein CFH79_04575 [Sulfurospirillum sp. UBA11407]|nr:MAG TPA: hypothetical protein CFH79_04575 [Sulfurospirillum sp. UBA11407]